MATRSTIKIQGISFAKVYKHWDGNPDSMMPWLTKFNKDFAENRGVDNSYKFAQLLRNSIVDGEEYGLDMNNYTGWGVVKFNEDCGEAYEYTLCENGDVTYKECY